ncbi:MAG: Ryanodine receptor Ryr [Paludibacteraceae bacterium]|nr:Ryanodine receptor Ryr [Paludibacteraceae bacterium]
MVRVLRSAADYEPQPLNLDDMVLTEDLLELQEAIAENAHEVWAAARKAEGWTYGAVRNDALKQHPDMLPYSALPDSEKEYDRLMAFNTIKLVKKLGWKLVRK